MKLDTQTRQKQIIETSLEIIRSGGIQKLTTKEIARRIGISEQAVYRHFNSKLHILTAVIRYFDDCFQELFDSIDLPDEPLDQIKKITSTHLEFFNNNPAVAAVIFSEEIFQNEKSLSMEVKQALEKRLKHMTSLISAGQHRGEIRNEFAADNLAHILLASMRLIVTRWRLAGFSYDLTKQGRLIIDDFLSLIEGPDILNEK